MTGLISLLMKEGARATNIARIISEINDSLIRRILEIAEKKFGKPPLPYSFIVYGSEGRREQTFKTDQDNAIIYLDPSNEKEAISAREYFEDFSNFVINSLLDCGFPPCPGKYMANNPKWCQPIKEWKKYFFKWINTPTPEAILKSLIFFDFRPLYGEFSLADDLRDYLIKIIKGQNIFLAKMAAVITKNRPPLGFFKTFIVEKSGEHKDELNLKISGIGPLVDLIRLFALETGIRETSTLDRIEALKTHHAIVNEMADDLKHIFEFIMLLRMHQQMKQIENNMAPDNFINPAKLSNLERKSLKESFQLISRVQDIVIDQYRPGMIGG